MLKAALRVMYEDTRHRLLCLRTRDAGRREASAARVLAVVVPALDAGRCPLVVCRPYRAWTWALHYLAAPLRRLRGW